jgi:membrane associated rhomboid family serine protease
VFPLYDTLIGKRFPWMTVILICANILIFACWQNPHLDATIWWHGFRPCEVNSHCTSGGTAWPLDLLTSMFMHASWEHVLGNMLFLWIFGTNVEEALGALKFLGFYLVAGAVAAMTQTAVTLLFAPPHGDLVPLVGASGAIAGVLGAYLVLFPRSQILTFWLPAIFASGKPIMKIGANVYIIIWLGYQLFDGGFALLAPQAGGGVAFFAHIGGISFGFLTLRLFSKRKTLYNTHEADSDAVNLGDRRRSRDLPLVAIAACLAVSIVVVVVGVSPVAAANRPLPPEAQGLGSTQPASNAPDHAAGIAASMEKLDWAAESATSALRGGCHQRANDHRALRYRTCILTADQQVSQAFVEAGQKLRGCAAALPGAGTNLGQTPAELLTLAQATRTATGDQLRAQAASAADVVEADDQLYHQFAQLCHS